MKRLRNISGGMPLRLQDFDLIQDNLNDAIDCIIQSLVPGESALILKGLTVADGSTIVANAGWLYRSGEIYFVPQANFAFNASKILYLIPNTTTEESRTFKDGSIHEVHEIRNYAWGYDENPPIYAIRYDELYTLDKILKANILSLFGQTAILAPFITLPYASGFSPATSLTGLALLSNSFNVMMLHGAFTAQNGYGKLALLPIGQRPSADVVGYFFNGTSAPGVLKIKTNGEIHVTGAHTSQINYISFFFYKDFGNSVNYNLPVGAPAIPD